MLIAGLPRSRTAWLSVFMSQSSVHFHHEGLDGCNSIAEYKEKVSGCGDSSTGLVSLGVDLIGKSKVVIIEKNSDELQSCIDWCDSVYGVDSKEFISKLNSKLLLVNGLRIKQSDINDRLQDIWEYLVDDPWDDKYKELTKFNIQVQSANINEEAAKNLYESIQQNSQ